MKQKWLLAAMALALLPLSPYLLWSRNDFFPLDELRPGMRGIGKTCFQGNKPEEFQVEILGVLRGVGPGADAVLARLTGGPLDRTAVFEGMSGSPVFIDGKLLGAVAFSFPFPKEAIGGITPIRQMVDAFTEGKDSGSGGLKTILKKSMLWNYKTSQPEGRLDSPGLFAIPTDAGLWPAMAPFSGHSLVPISTPLSLGGFSPQAVRMFDSQLRGMGLTALQGTGASAKPQAQKDNTPLEPGSNIVVPLVRGDMDAW